MKSWRSRVEYQELEIKSWTSRVKNQELKIKSWRSKVGAQELEIRVGDQELININLKNLQYQVEILLS